ncbi:FumA C-terminus/TtdB family hydratase beta subunit [Thermococcus barophilus]|uniref:Fumarate hydratase beta subunit n=1 Tax=Thermococcus barophilus TaxID=55802 RepID=A0A0S1X871_THEBA|nr:FumA C-terminus/TtdB family hydratase beta subunit [Thermococcus barophilus]ALM73994.1 fumarate hydratase beta subunit [Thermococcus barophilus]
MAVYNLKTPLSEEEVRKLHVGDIVYISGVVVTARDEAHHRILEYIKDGKPLPVDLRGGVIYHCGPVVRKMNGEWEVIAAGPTTSTRMEMFEAEVIEKTGIRMIVGKGGMKDRTAKACKEYGAVYVTFTGGAAVLAAKTIKRVLSVEWLDLGIPEALWVFEVENFGPLTVTIDSTGRNYTEEVLNNAKAKREEVLKKLGVRIM